MFDYAQQLTLNGPNTSYSLSAMTFGINIADPNTGFALFLDFYTGANLSPTATNALASATFIKELGFDIAAGTVATAGSYNFTLTFPAFMVPSNTFTIAAALTTEDGSAYTTTDVANSRYSLSAPTTGTSPGFVWADTNLDGVFAGSEQTTFGGTVANIRMDVTAAAQVPEPSTTAAFALGLVLLGAWQFRRRRVSAAA
ncbi:MAG TPA: PEP-CTERM sorting domain-containing protein [Chthoniobacterales bacterium]